MDREQRLQNAAGSLKLLLIGSHQEDYFIIHDLRAKCDFKVARLDQASDLRGGTGHLRFRFAISRANSAAREYFSNRGKQQVIFVTAAPRVTPEAPASDVKSTERQRND